MPDHYLKRVWGPEDTLMWVNWIDDMSTSQNALPAGFVYVPYSYNVNHLRDRAFFLSNNLFWPRNSCCPFVGNIAPFYGGSPKRINRNGVPAPTDFSGDGNRNSSFGETCEICIIVTQDNSALNPSPEIWPDWALTVFSLIDYGGAGSNETIRLRQILRVREKIDTTGNGIADRIRTHTFTLSDKTRTQGDPSPWFPHICVDEIAFDQATFPLTWTERSWPVQNVLYGSGTNYNPAHPSVWDTFLPCVFQHKISAYRMSVPRSPSLADVAHPAHWDIGCGEPAEPPIS